MTHFLYIPMTGFGSFNGYRGDKWLRNRLTIFKTFVLPAILNQTKKEFILWFSFRPEEKLNPIVKDFWRFMLKIRGMTPVFTYHGVCIYDDKYPDDIARQRLIRSLGATLPELKEYIHDDWVYVTCQPSDDMYSNDAVNIIQSQEPKEKKAFGWTKGYIMNYATKEVAEYNPETHPPFATIVYPKEKFLDPWAHLEYTGPWKSHEFVKDYFNFTELPDRHFCVGTHGENISTTFNHPYKGKEFGPGEREKIWLKFGCWEADPVIVHRRVRLWGRILFNKIPKSLQPLIKTTYHKLRDIYVALQR